MFRSSWYAAAATAAALALGACASNTDSNMSSALESNARTTTTTTTTEQTTTTAQAAQSAQAATPAQPDAAAPAPTGEYTDAQLRSFAAAAVEIQPISQRLATATPEQRTAAADQIRTILTRNNLDGATYNAIAARAQTDAAFASRIAALSPQATTPQG